MHNANGRHLAIPGEMRLHLAMHDNGMASQTVVPIQQPPNGLDVHIFGGLTKLEEIASRVAGGMTDGRIIDPVDEDVGRIAKLSVRIAKAIMAECQAEQERERVEAQASQ